MPLLSTAGDGEDIISARVVENDRGSRSPEGVSDRIHTRYRGATSARRFHRGSGGWENVEEGSGHCLSVHASREQAVAVGRVLAMNAETTHVVHDEDGTVSYEDDLGSDGYSPRWPA